LAGTYRGASFLKIRQKFYHSLRRKEHPNYNLPKRTNKADAPATKRNTTCPANREPKKQPTKQAKTEQQRKQDTMHSN
jgi:hypothetical protein